MRKFRALPALLLALTFAFSATAAQDTAHAGVRIISVGSEVEAADIRTRVEAGESFSDLAKKHSTDASARAEGYLGIIIVANLRKEFQDAITMLRRSRPGAVSPVLKVTADQYFLLQLVSDAETQSLQFLLDAADHFHHGIALQNQGKPEEAKAEFHEALRINPNLSEAHGGLGYTLLDEGRLDEAMAEFQEAIRMNPQDVIAHYNLGNALQDRGMLELAGFEYREVIRIDPRNADAHSNLGNALRRQGRLDESIVEHREAIRINPQSAVRHYNLGNALQDQGKLESAGIEYREALRINPQYALAHNNLGNVLRNTDEAIAEYHDAIRINPNLAQAHYNLGEALRRQGDRAGAARAFRDFLTLAAGSVESKDKIENARRTLADLEKKEGQ
jgi:tetratricopeptide (TPR) repeat protein